MSPERSDDVDVHIVVACLQHQQETVRETLPTLMSGAVYADKLTVVTFEADTLIELADFYPIQDAFADFFEYIGADSFGSITDGVDEYADDEQFESLILDELWVNLARRRLESETDPDRRAFLESGIREKEPLIAASRRAREAEDIDREVRGVLRIVEELLSAPNVFPFVFDPDGVLLEDSAALTRLSRGSKKRLEAEARLGPGLIDKLPSFDQLGPAEILEIRRRLHDLLVPFRGYVSETSIALDSVGRDEEAIADVVHDIYVGKVRPVLQEINDLVTRSGYFRTLLREFGRDPKGFATSFVTFGLGNLAHLPTYATASAAASTELLRIKHEALIQRREARWNRLYYLHQLEARIEARS